MQAITERADTQYPLEQRGHVGLGPKRPFHFCTWQWGCSAPRFEYAGDDPEPHFHFQTRSIRAHVVETPESCRVALHRHEFYEIAFIHRGEALHVTPGDETPLRRGHAVIVTPSGLHGYEAIRGLGKTNLYLQPEWLAEDLRVLWSERGLVQFLLADSFMRRNLYGGVLTLTLADDMLRRCEREIEELHAEARRSRPSLLLYNGSLLKLLRVLNESFIASYEPPASLLREEVWIAAEHLDQRAQAGEDMQIESLWRRVSLSESTFRRVFKAEVGCSPKQYYQRRRVMIAQRRLVDSGSSVTRIAAELGFSDSAHFARVFRNLCGITPTEYRARQLAMGKMP